MKSKSQELLEVMVNAIVEKPEDISIVETTDDLGVLLTLRVALSDMGTVVGKQGATAKAMRTLLRITGTRENARVNLKIEEPEGSTRVPKLSTETSEE